MSIPSLRNTMFLYITTGHTNRHFLTLQCSVNNVFDLKWFGINKVVVSFLSRLAMEHQQDVRNYITVIKHANVVPFFFTFKDWSRWYVVLYKNLAGFFDWYISIAISLLIHALWKDTSNPYISITFWFWIKLDAGIMVQSVELVVIPSLWAIIFMLNCYCGKKKEEKESEAMKPNKKRPVGHRNSLTFALQSALIGSLWWAHFI